MFNKGIREHSNPLDNILAKNYSNSIDNKKKDIRSLLKGAIVYIALAGGVLIILSLIGQYYRYFFNGGKETYITELFNLDKEMNFPSYFSSQILFISSILSFLIFWANKKMGVKYYSNWLLMGVLFLFMSMDEILQLHEQFNRPVREVLHTQGFFYFGWLIPAGIIILSLALYNLNFFLSLKRRYQFLFFTSGFIYLMGAYVMEMVGGKYLSILGQDNFGYAVVTTIEESLELCGIGFFLYSLFEYIKDELQGLYITLN